MTVLVSICTGYGTVQRYLLKYQNVLKLAVLVHEHQPAGHSVLECPHQEAALTPLSRLSLRPVRFSSYNRRPFPVKLTRATLPVFRVSGTPNALSHLR